MSRVEQATLSDGRTVDYVVVDDPPAGAMKKTYFAPDGSYVIQFYLDQASAADPYRRARLDAVLGKYNPTLDPKDSAFFKKLYCWPTGIVVRPQLGIMAPAFASNYWFRAGPFTGKEKEGTWFLLEKPRRMLPEGERGTWDRYLQICILIARAVRKLHTAGLAHSDLSPRNILVDPSSGQSTVIDIDSLVVPGIFPADVIGTPGYIAPEVLATIDLPLGDPHRKHANVRTDLHALAVLLYEFLLVRHPLKGFKVHSTASPEEDERLAMGERALFIEHPSDTSNRRSDLTVPYTVLGPQLSELVERAFIKGLHRPEHRPTAIEWERALVKTWDLRIDCKNASCPNRWFILHDKLRSNPRCPFCGTRRTGTVPVLKFYSQKRAGQWSPDGELVVHHNLFIFEWHVFDNIFPGETADRTPRAYCVLHRSQWLLVNQNLSSLKDPEGRLVAPGSWVELKHGARFSLSEEGHGRIAEVEVLSSG